MQDIDEQMPGFPVMLQLGTRWRGLIVGGGAVAYRRYRTLAEAGGDIAVIAPQIDARFEPHDITIIPAIFDPAQHSLAGYRVVVAATNDVEVNDAITAAIRAMPNPPLLNRVDKAWRESDISFMSQHREGPVTLGVHTGGTSASAARGIRDELASKLDPAWASVLKLAAPYRQRIKEAVSDPKVRREYLFQLSDSAMLSAFAKGGESAVRDRLNAIMERLA